MPDAATIRAEVRRVPFGTLPAFPDLFETYCTDYEAVRDFFSGDFRSAEARRAAADRAAGYPRDRATLVEVLLGQNAAWGLDEHTRLQIEALADPEAVAVVTGQQVGLLTGPLYTPYKTLTTIQLARQLAEETGRPVVPVFWLEGEDHDFAEVAGVHLLRGNEPVTFRYEGHSTASGENREPVGRIVLTDQIETLLDAIGETLPPTDFHETLLRHLRAAYRPGVSLRDAFARLLRAFFPEAGLVFISPDDARLKRLATPLFRREIEDYGTAARRLQEVSERLADQFHVQVNTRPANLFLLTDEGRIALDATEAGFALRGEQRAYTRAELLDLLKAAPERFSPNVVLRPLMQDLLLPTAAYVAGPGEISYFAQFKPLYAWAGLPMPVLYPRASATLVEAKIQKVLDQYDLSVADLGADLEPLFRRLVLEQMDVDIEEVFSGALRHLHEAVNTLKPLVEQMDRSLGKTAEATRASLTKELDRLKQRVVKAEKRNHDELRGRLEKARVNLFPDGKLQERTLSPLYFLNKYGFHLLSDLTDTLSLDTTAHQIVVL